MDLKLDILVLRTDAEVLQEVVGGDGCYRGRYQTMYGILKMTKII